MDRRWPVWGLTALSVAILTAGVIATGGPAQGRAEKRDQARQQDLSEIQMLLACKSQQAGHVVTDPAATDACPATPRLADPFTGTPYRIESVTADTIRLCAGFELPPERHNAARDDAGCIVQRIVIDPPR